MLSVPRTTRIVEPGFIVTSDSHRKTQFENLEPSSPNPKTWGHRWIGKSASSPGDLVPGINVTGKSGVIVGVRLPAVGGIIFLAIEMKMDSQHWDLIVACYRQLPPIYRLRLS